MILATLMAVWVPCTPIQNTPENELQRPAEGEEASVLEENAPQLEEPAETPALPLPSPLAEALEAAGRFALWKAPLDVSLFGRLLGLRVSASESDRSELQPRNRREAALRAALLEENSAPGGRIVTTFPLGSSPAQVSGADIRDGWRVSPGTPGTDIAGQSGVTAELIWNSSTASAPPPGTLKTGPMGPIVGTPGLWKITLEDTGTGWNEEFLLQVPSLPGVTAAEARPLLVAFHAFNVSMFDIAVNTDFPDEAEARGWFLLAPLGADRASTGSREGQINTRLALEYVLNRYAIDLSRIYGVGFSGGGGNALNFAARSTDCTGPVFAAVVNHTGVLSQQHSFTHDCGPTGAGCPNETPWEFWFGDTPQNVPFEYQLASVLDVSYVPGFSGPAPPSDPFTSLASNLVHMPILSHWAVGDPLLELVVQNEAFTAHMQTLGSTRHETQIVVSSDHLWQTLNADEACKWLSQFVCEAPRSGNSLGFEDGRIFHFEIEQDTAGAFSPFSWSLDEKLGQLSIENTVNLEKISIDLRAVGFTPQSSGLEISLRPGDATTDQIVLEGVESPPTIVIRDGSTVNAPWAYNSAMNRLTLWESDGVTPHVWAVNF